MGHIFDYILKKRDFQRDHIGRYKDEKTYSYFDSRFVDEILPHIIADIAMKIVYRKIRASTTATLRNCGLQFKIMEKYWLAGVRANHCCNQLPL